MRHTSSGSGFVAANGSRPRWVSSLGWRVLGQALLFGAAYAGAALAGHALTLDSGAKIASFWPAAGLALGVLLFVPPRRWPVLVSAMIVANVAVDVSFAGQQPITAVGLAAANAVEAAFGAALIRRLARHMPPKLGAPRDMMALGVAALAAPAVSGTIGAPVVSFATGAPFMVIWVGWWTSDMLGIVLVAPAMLALTGIARSVTGSPDLSRKPISPWRWLEASVALLVTSAAGAYVYCSQSTAPFGFLAVPSLLWAAVRFGPVMATAAFSILATFAIGGTLTGHGPFAVPGMGMAERATLLQLFLGMTAAITHAFATLEAERGRAAGALARINRDLEQEIDARTAELRNAVLARLETETSFEATFEQAAVGIAHVGLDGRWQRVNRRLCDMLGYTAEELRQRTVRSITHPEDWPIDAAHIRSLLRNDIATYTLEKRYVRKDGSAQWISLTVSAVRNTRGEPIRFVAVIVDISARKAAEAALAESEARLRLFVERAPAAIAMFDSDMRYLSVSRRYLKDYGLGAEAPDAVVGRSHYDVFPNLPDRWQEMHRRVLGGGTVSAAEDSFQREDGRIDWLRWELTPWYRADRSVGGALLFTEVITEAKLARDALHQVEAEQRDLLATLDLAAFMARGWDGTIRHWSDGCARLFGWSAEEAIGQNAHILLHARFSAPFEDVQKALREHGVWTGDLYQRTRDGREVIVLARKILRRGDGGDGDTVMEVFTDVTAQRHAERALADSEAFLRSVLEASTDCLKVIDRDGTLAMISHNGLCAMEIEDAATVIGRAWVALWPAESGDLVREAVQAALAGHSGRFEAYCPTAKGTPKWWDVVVAPIGEIGRQPRRILSISREITERKMVEATLRDLNATLEARVREAVAAREAAQARAAHAERMQALGQLAGGIAHDINNVLQTVQGAAALIERRATSDDRVHRFARMIQDATGRGASITHRLLAFSRQADLHAEAVDPAALLVGLREMLAHTLGVEITIDLQLDNDLPPLMADKGQLETALVNLATNARDAMPGGGTLILSARVDQVSANDHPASLAAGDYLRITVSDSGTGMDPATLRRVSEPFFTTKAAGKGTGLGLSMAKGFAEQSGGGMLIESALGDGTAVSLWLPLAAQQEPIGLDTRSPAPDALASRVLLVEDQVLVREILAAALEDAGCQVLTAASGAEALALLGAGEAVDILVTDLSMPGMDGASLIRAVQACRPDLPAIMLTGYAGADTSLLTGPDPITGTGRPRRFSLLRKPVTTARVVDEIAVMLETQAASA